VAVFFLRRRQLICVFGTAPIAALALVVADARAADTSPPRLKKRRSCSMSTRTGAPTESS